MWIKICANTVAEDAQAAVDLGADAVGFVFAPSVRRVTPEGAGEIVSRLVGDVERVGVFPDWDLRAVREAVAVAGLSGVQLHGTYQLETVRGLRREFGDAVTIAQTLHWEVGSPNATGEDATLSGDRAAGKHRAPDGGLGSIADRLLQRVREIVDDGFIDRLLVDSKVGAVLGGTGQIFDWTAAEKLFAQAGARMIVAGGLNAENVGGAIGRLRPWGVDVASGVESLPGRKDRGQLRLFIQRAKAAADELNLVGSLGEQELQRQSFASDNHEQEPKL